MENNRGEDYKNSTLEKIKRLKHDTFGRTAVKCKYADGEFELILLTLECAKSRDMMDLLGRWRKENEHWYLSQFPVSIERTTTWFVEKVIDIADRMLFIIQISGRYIGHVGLFRFDLDRQTCEIDNILRGENDYPGIMGCAVRGMMSWAKSNLKLNGYSLKVLSDNQRAIKLYRNLGYQEVSRIPLIQVKGRDGLEWIEAPQGCSDELARCYVVMESV